jgi:hypothetical protein
MNMPGFTAETSLYQTNNHYRFAAGGSFLSNGNTTVTPQGCGVIEGIACGFVIAICLPVVAVVCGVDPDPIACAGAWAACLGVSYGTCKDCIPDSSGGGGGGPPTCCRFGSTCECGGRCVTRSDGTGIIDCVDGTCLKPGQKCP